MAEALSGRFALADLLAVAGLRCGIRRETDHHRYNAYRGPVGETFENLIARDFSADGPW